jgi:hypothetical protein
LVAFELLFWCQSTQRCVLSVLRFDRQLLRGVKSDGCTVGVTAVFLFFFFLVFVFLFSSLKHTDGVFVVFSGC